MKTRINSKLITGAIALLLAFSATTHGSHHFESQQSATGPAYDLLDVYVFPSEESGYTTFIATVNPGVRPGGASPFSDDGLYNVHIARNRSLSEGMTITLQFGGSRGRVGLIEDANEDVGALGDDIGEIELDRSAALAKGIHAWAGAIRDPFMGNCVGLARQHVSEDLGQFNPDAYDNEVDFFEPRTAGAIVLEVPNLLLGDTVYAFATTAKRDGDSWVQINRLANPLLTHMFMHFDPENTVAHVSGRPDTDSMRKSAIRGHILRMVTLAKSHEDDPVSYADSIVDRLLPDLIGYSVGGSPSYEAGSMGGRGLSDDVMDSQISLYWGHPVTDGANENADRHKASFPYVIALSSLPDGKPPGFDQLPGCAP